MNEKMSFGEIRRDIKDNTKAKNRHEEKERKWNVYDSYIYSFGYTFADTLPEVYTKDIYEKPEVDAEEYGEPFRKYIVDTLSSVKGKHTAIEFGGPGSALFSAFSNDLLEKTIGVCLEDIRSSSEIERDAGYGHSIVSGDILDTSNIELYEEINKKLSSDKTDLIISRMMGPLNDIAKNPLVLDRIIRKWYSMLNENGIIFVQFDYFFKQFNRKEKSKVSNVSAFRSEVRTDVEAWASSVQKKFPNEIEIQIGEEGIRIHKKIGAPEELPSIKELFNQNMNNI